MKLRTYCTRAGRTLQRRDGRIEEYWNWFAVSLFLLVTVDLLTTIGAVTEYGLGAENNPVMEWLLRQGPILLTVANLVVVGLAVYSFSGVVETIRRAPAPYDRYLEFGTEVWVGGLVALGLANFAINLSVIVWGTVPY